MHNRELPLEHPVSFSILLSAARLAGWNADRTNELLASAARCAAEIESVLPEVLPELRAKVLGIVAKEWCEIATFVLEGAVGMLDCLASRARLHVLLPPAETAQAKASAAA